MQAQLSHFSLNGQVLPTTQFADALVEGQTSVYEVIKTIDNRPVFLREHLQRLAQSLSQAGFDPAWAQPIAPAIQQLLAQCPVVRHNLRVAVVFDEAGRHLRSAVYFIASHYPSPDNYRLGVTVGIMPAERNNPTAKVEQLELRQRANRMMADQGLFEVLLENGQGLITEGSRSNVFMVHSDGHLLTAPDEAVLGGITRDVVLSIARRSGVVVEMRCPSTAELSTLQAMFITGTSPCVLPVRRCGDITLNAQHPLVASLAQQYAQAEAADIGGAHHYV